MPAQLKNGSREKSWLIQAINDTDSALLLYDNGYHSQALFLLEQSFEKMLKFIGLMHGTIDLKGARNLSHHGVENILSSIVSVQYHFLASNPDKLKRETKEWLQERKKEIITIIAQSKDQEILAKYFAKIINGIKSNYRKTPFTNEERSTDDELINVGKKISEVLGFPVSTTHEITQLVDNYKEVRGKHEVESFRNRNLLSANFFCFLILSVEFPNFRYPNEKMNQSPSEYYIRTHYAIQLFPTMHKTLSEYLIFQKRYLE